MPTVSALKKFLDARKRQVKKNLKDPFLRHSAAQLQQDLIRTNYTHNFTWMGQPIIQFPTDMFVLQELIWTVKPDLIIECGVAWGGMTLFMASILDVIGRGRVLGIDIEIRAHNRRAILPHPAAKRIHLYEASSLDKVVFDIATRICAEGTRMVCLDSNHTHDHVLAELNLYAPLVTKDSYLIVFDTAVELTGEDPKDRPWGPGNNPMTAVREFLRTEAGSDFEVDVDLAQRAVLTECPGGYLRRRR